tara:strand:- start:27 stop:161 length:135 start_codon:yes stop_codon:yes gene_type:complete
MRIGLQKKLNGLKQKLSKTGKLSPEASGLVLLSRKEQELINISQ